MAFVLFPKVRKCTFSLQAFCQGPEGRSLNSFGRRRRRDTFRKGRDLTDDINLREMFRVYETREEIPNVSQQKTTTTDFDKEICLTYPEYYGLVITFLVRTYIRMCAINRIRNVFSL